MTETDRLTIAIAALSQIADAVRRPFGKDARIARRIALGTLMEITKCTERTQPGWTEANAPRP